MKKLLLITTFFLLACSPTSNEESSAEKLYGWWGEIKINEAKQEEDHLYQCFSSNGEDHFFWIIFDTSEDEKEVIFVNWLKSEWSADDSFIYSEIVEAAWLNGSSSIHWFDRLTLEPYSDDQGVTQTAYKINNESFITSTGTHQRIIPLEEIADLCQY